MSFNKAILAIGIAAATAVAGVVMNGKKKENAKQTNLMDGTDILYGKIKNHPVGVSVHHDMTGINNNAIIVGASGTGKSYNHVATNLLNMATSAVVFNPDGELDDLLAQELEDNGYQVFCFRSLYPTSSEETKEHFVQRLKDAVYCISKEKGVIFLNCVCTDPETGTEVLNVTESPYSMNDLLLMVYNALLEENTKYPVTFYLDAVDNMPVMPDLSKKMMQAKVHHIGFQIVIQSFRQLKELYQENDEWLSLMSAADTLLHTGSPNMDNEKFLKKYYSVPDNIIQQMNYQHPNLLLIKGRQPTLCENLFPDFIDIDNV